MADDRRRLMELYWCGLDERAEWLPMDLISKFVKFGRYMCKPEEFEGYENAEHIVAYLHKPVPLLVPRSHATSHCGGSRPTSLRSKLSEM